MSVTFKNLPSTNPIGDAGIIGDIEYDRVDVAYPSGAVEVFTYSLSGNTQSTVTITYTANNKNDILNVVRT
tara:strand:- start:353 stop:565 length:213 start_codon:yes stop_codon:yes gene_type:complete